jgi:acyl carrier protein phosphodiesterase
MNFLAHLWLSEQARLPLAGAILGDTLRGALPADMPAPLLQSVQLHRHVDAATDRHPRVRAARATFADGQRRYAGILLDVLYDHLLARQWRDYSPEPLDDFAHRAARAVAAEARWFEHAGVPAPRAASFAALLASYRDEDGIERALLRTAGRLRQPEGLVLTMAGWRARLPLLEGDLPELLTELRQLAARHPAPPKV